MLNRSLSEANEELTNRVQELDTLYKVGKSVTSQLSKDQLLERVLDAAFHVLEAEDAALIGELGRDKTRLKGWWGDQSEVPREERKRDPTLGQLAREVAEQLEELAKTAQK